MKATANRLGLLQALAAVGPAVAGRTTKTALTMVKLECLGDAMAVSGTDLEVGVRYDLPGVKVDAPGVVLVPTGRLESLLRKCPDADVSLTADGTTLRLRTTFGRFEILGGDPAELPEVEPFDAAAPHWTLPAGTLRRLVNRTRSAVSAKDTDTWTICGLNFVFAGSRLTVAGTDTKRVGEDAAAVTPAAGAEKADGTVPIKAVGLILAALADDGEAVRVVVTRNACVVRTERATVRTSLLTGRFPPYHSIVPKRFAAKIDLPAADFRDRVETASIMAADELGKRVDFHFEPGRVLLTAAGKDSGSGDLELDLPGYDGPELDVGMEAKFVLDALKAAGDAQTVQLEMVSGEKPVVFSAGDEWRTIIMPRTNV